VYILASIVIRFILKKCFVGCILGVLVTTVTLLDDFQVDHGKFAISVETSLEIMQAAAHDFKLSCS